MKSKEKTRARIVGFDCSEDSHEAVLLDEAGQDRLSMSLVNQLEAVETALAELLLHVHVNSDLVVVVESGRSHGRLVCDVAHRLGCRVVQVNTVALNHYRDVEGQPHKTDPWDAYLAARMVYQKLNGCHELSVPLSEERILCRLSRTHSRLVDERSALLARIRSQFVELVPEVLHDAWEGPKYKSKAMRYILQRWPAFEGLGTAHFQSVEKILRKCRYGDRAPHATRLIKQMAAKIAMEPSERKVVALEIRLLVRQVQVLEESLAEVDCEIKRRVDLHEVGPKLLEMPGVAYFTAAVLIGELLPIARTTSEGRSATYSGVTPISRQSGKRLNRKSLARGVNKRILHAIYQSSVTAIRCSAIDRAYYEKKLKDYAGHPKPHVAAFIALSRQRHKVVFILMTTAAHYDLEMLVSRHLKRIHKPAAA